MSRQQEDVLLLLPSVVRLVIVELEISWLACALSSEDHLMRNDGQFDPVSWTLETDSHFLSFTV